MKLKPDYFLRRSASSEPNPSAAKASVPGSGTGLTRPKTKFGVVFHEGVDTKPPSPNVWVAKVDSPIQPDVVTLPFAPYQDSTEANVLPMLADHPIAIKLALAPPATP